MAFTVEQFLALSFPNTQPSKQLEPDKYWDDLSRLVETHPPILPIIFPFPKRKA